MDPEKMHEAWKIPRVMSIIIQYLFMSWEYPDETNLGFLRQVSSYFKGVVQSQIGVLRRLPAFRNRNKARQFVAIYFGRMKPNGNPKIYFTRPSNNFNFHSETIQVGEQNTRVQLSSSAFSLALTKLKFYGRATLAANPLRVNIRDRLIRVINSKDFSVELFHGDILITFQSNIPKAVFFFSRHSIPQDFIHTMMNDAIALGAAFGFEGRKLTFYKEKYFESLFKNKEISKDELEVARLLLSFDKQIGSSILGSLLIKRKRSQEGLAEGADSANERQ